VLLAACALCLALLECAARLYHEPVPDFAAYIRVTDSPHYRADSELGWLPRANAVGKHTLRGSFDATFRTNSRGARSREIGYERTAGLRRILVLGDSFAWGHGVEDDETFASRLERLLPRTEVVNLGVSAYGLPQEIRYFELEGRRYGPDVVVLALCSNDVSKPEGTARRPGDVAPASAGDDSEASAGAFLRLKGVLRQRSAAYGFLSERINTSETLIGLLVEIGLKGAPPDFEALDSNLSPFLRRHPPELAAHWEATRLDLLRLARLVRAEDARLVVALVPALQSVSPRAFSHSIAYSRFGADDFDLDRF